jgi:catechol 2,3-dioxygenase-like lactoylglutathione lyase family enzyme
MHSIQGVIETGVYVNDLEQAEAFYHEILGLAVIGREAGRHVFFQAGEAGVLLVFNPVATQTGDGLPAHGARGAGHFALGIAAEDVEAWRTRLQERGVAIEKEITWPRGGRSLYFRDPAGNSVELITPGVWGLSAGW